MAFDSFALLASLLVTLTALVLLLVNDWRVSVVALAIQYVGIFALVGLEWPLTMALVKLIAGWMTGAVLGMAILSTAEIRGESGSDRSALAGPYPDAATPSSSRLFRLLVALLVGLAAVSQVPALAEQIPGFSPEQTWGGLILVGLGLLNLGFTAQPLATILGLLTVLGGFEIVFASLEAAPLTAGLLAGINMGLALTGAYLLLAPNMEEAE